MPLMAAPGTGARDEPDADRMLAELLPQGTEVSDADVDALLQELEKPLKRTPRRTYQPSSSRSAAPPPMPLPRMPNARDAQGGSSERYNPQERNLVAEAARAIGVEPKPRAPVPRMALNRRPLHQVLEERRQRQARTEMDRANNELFATMGVENLKLSDAEADAFLNEGIIPDTAGRNAPSAPATSRAAEPTEKSEPEGHDTKPNEHEQAETVPARADGAKDATTNEVKQELEEAKETLMEAKEAQPEDAEAKSAMQSGGARDELATEDVPANDNEATPAADAAAATKDEAAEPLKDDTSVVKETNEPQRPDEGSLTEERLDEPKVQESTGAEPSEPFVNRSTQAVPAEDSHLTKATEGGQETAEQANEPTGAEETRPSAVEEELLPERVNEPASESAEASAAKETATTFEGTETGVTEESLVDLSEDTHERAADDKREDMTHDAAALTPLPGQPSEGNPSEAATLAAASDKDAEKIGSQRNTQDNSKERQEVDTGDLGEGPAPKPKELDRAAEDPSVAATSLPESADTNSAEMRIEEPRSDAQGLLASRQEHEVPDIQDRSIPEEYMTGPETVPSTDMETTKRLDELKAPEQPSATEAGTGATRVPSGSEPPAASNLFSDDDSQDNLWEHIADEQEQATREAEASFASHGGEQSTEQSLLDIEPEAHNAESMPHVDESQEQVTEQLRGVSLSASSFEQSKDKGPSALKDERSELAPMDESFQDPSKTEGSVSASEYSQEPSTDKSFDHPGTDKGLFGDDSHDNLNWERSIALEKDKGAEESDKPALGLFGADPGLGSGSDELWTEDRALDDDISKHVWSKEDPYKNMVDVALGVQDLSIGDTSKGLGGLPRDTELDAGGARRASEQAASADFLKNMQESESERPAQSKDTSMADPPFQPVDEQASADTSWHTQREEPSVFSIPSAAEGDEEPRSARSDMQLPSVAMPAGSEPESNTGADPFWAPSFETSSSPEFEPQDKKPELASGANLSNDFSFDFDDGEPSRETRQSSGPDPLLLSALGVTAGNDGDANPPFEVPAAPQERQAETASTGVMEGEDLDNESGGQQVFEPGMPKGPMDLPEDEQTGVHASGPRGEEPVEQTDKGILDPAEQLVEQHTESPTKQPAERIAEPPKQAAEQSAEQSAGQLDPQLVESYVEGPVKEPTEQPVAHLGNEPTEQTSDRSAKPLPELPAERTVKQPAKALSEQPVEQPIEQSAEQPAEQTAEQPEPELIGQPKQEEDEGAVKDPDQLSSAAGKHDDLGTSEPVAEPPNDEEMAAAKQFDEQQQRSSVQPPATSPSTAHRAAETVHSTTSPSPAEPDLQAKQAQALPERTSQQTSLPTTPPETTPPVTTPRSQTPSVADQEAAKSPSDSTSPRPPTLPPRSASKPRQDSLAQSPPVPSRLYPNPLLLVGSNRSRSGTYSPSQQSTPEWSTPSRPGQSHSSPFTNIPPSRSVPRWLLEEDEAPWQSRTPSDQVRSPAADRSSAGTFSPSFYRSTPSFSGASPRTEHSGPGASSPDVSRSTNRSFDVSQTSQASRTSETQRKRLSDIMREADEILQEWS